MKQLYITFSMCLFFLNSSSGNEIYRDVVNDTYVSYDRSTMIFETTSFGKKMSIECLHLLEDNWAGKTHFNSEMKRLSEYLLTSQKVYSNFISHFDSSLDFLISNQLKTSYTSDSTLKIRQSYQPEIRRANCSLISLCNNIAVVSFGIIFSASSSEENNKFNKLKYEEIRYFNLETGDEINPSNWINKRMKNEFAKTVKNSIASEFNDQISTDKIRKGLPFFNGAGFYFQLQGNSNIETNGIPTIQVRFSLSEIQPYLNTAGPFSAYIDKKESPNFHHNSFQEKSGSFQEMYWYLGKESYALGIRSLAKNFKVKPGIEHSRYFLTKDNDSRHIVLENHYDTKGKVSCQKTYHESVSPPLIEDSIIFEYWSNGSIKSICFYELNSYEVMEIEHFNMFLIKSFLYDKDGNLIIEKSFDWVDGDCLDCREEFVVYYTYLNDRIIEEHTVRTQLEFATLRGAVQYTSKDGYMVHSWSSQMEATTQVQIVLSENKRVYQFYSKGISNYDLELEVKDERVKSGKFDYKKPLKTDYHKSHFTIDFNQYGNIISYEEISTYQDHQIPYFTEIEYNENQLPQKFIRKGTYASQTKVYEIEYY